MSNPVTPAMLNKLGSVFVSDGACRKRKCCANVQRWKTPQGYLRELDAETLLPHLSTCKYEPGWVARGLRIGYSTFLIAAFTTLYFVLTVIMAFLMLGIKLPRLLAIPVAVVCFVCAIYTLKNLFKDEKAEALKRKRFALDAWFMEVDHARNALR